jgi:hypothetical protein
MTDESQLFAPKKSGGFADVPMGTRGPNGRYRMPLLPGEQGTKTGGDWVPGGLQSMTNLAGSISDTRALGIWEIEQILIGLGLRLAGSDDLCSELREIVLAAWVNEYDFQNIKAYPELKAALADIAERAKDASGANAARDKGIRMHDHWEEHSKTQLFSGDEEDQRLTRMVAELVDAAGFELMPDLTERTVRNLAVKAAGRFDNILRHRKTGELYIADLKSKAKPFWSFLEIDGQLAGYANAEWMLRSCMTEYLRGPVHYVNLQYGVVLHMPSRPDENGSQEPRLRKADLVTGWKNMQLARQVCDARSYGRSAARMADSWWPVS